MRRILLLGKRIYSRQLMTSLVKSQRKLYPIEFCVLIVIRTVGFLFSAFLTDQNSSRTHSDTMARPKQSKVKTVKKKNTVSGTVKKSDKKSSGSMSLKEIKKQQAETKFLIPKKPFADLVKGIAEEIMTERRHSSDAIKSDVMSGKRSLRSSTRR